MPYGFSWLEDYFDGWLAYQWQRKLRRMQMRVVMALLVVTLFLLASVAINAQCVEKPNDPCVPVNQSILDRAGRAADELLAARDALVKHASERTVTDAERKAAATLIDGLNQLVATGQRIQDEQTKVITLYKNVIEMYQGIVERLEKMIARPQSGWQRFASLLKTVGNILAGIALGRAL